MSEMASKETELHSSTRSHRFATPIVIGFARLSGEMTGPCKGLDAAMPRRYFLIGGFHKRRAPIHFEPPPASCPGVPFASTEIQL